MVVPEPPTLWLANSPIPPHPLARCPSGSHPITAKEKAPYHQLTPTEFADTDCGNPITTGPHPAQARSRRPGRHLRAGKGRGLGWSTTQHPPEKARQLLRPRGGHLGLEEEPCLTGAPTAWM
jgi:hypothetical protein